MLDLLEKVWFLESSKNLRVDNEVHEECEKTIGKKVTGTVVDRGDRSPDHVVV